MTAHDHRVVVPGCYRCELGRDEVAGYSWDEDWPRITIEWPEIGRIPDGIVSRPVLSKTPKCYFQPDAATLRTEITRDEYERIYDEWERRRASENKESAP